MFLRICILFFLAFSTSANAGTDIYNCDLDAKQFRGWVPSHVVITFLNDGAKAQINFGHKSENIQVLKYGSKFKEVRALINMQSSDGKNYSTKHTINIFKDYKISYNFIATGTSTNFVGRGDCTYKRVSANSNNTQYTKERVSDNSSNSQSANECSNQPYLCSDAQVCQSATFENSNGKRFWSTSGKAAQYIVEAKSRTLNCGTGNKATAKKETCSNDPLVCTNTQICEKATYTQGPTKKWYTNSSRASYVRRAKALGLRCGVEPTIEKTTVKIDSLRGQVQNTTSADQAITNSQNGPVLYEAQKLTCTDIGFVSGTPEFADCVLKLIMMGNKTIGPNSVSSSSSQKISYESAERICKLEADAGASSTYQPITPQTNSYRSDCRYNGLNHINCNTVGGGVNDGGFSNLANTLSKNANAYKLFEACILKYGYEPPKRNILQKLFGIK